MRSVFLADEAWVNGREMRRDAAVVVGGAVVLDIVSRSQVGSSFDGTRHRVPVLLPGFINAHSHLEYSWLRGRLPRGRVPFPEWVEAIGAAKREVDSQQIGDAARDGISEMIAGGATTVVDCAHRDEAPAALAASPLRHVVLWELLGLDDSRAASVAAHAEARLPAQVGAPSRIAAGVNPHAPYTVGVALRAWLRVFLASNPDAPCAWHLAETPEEMAFMDDHTGPLASFFRRMRIPFPTPEPSGCSAVEFLRREGLLGRCDMAFHLNLAPKGEYSVFATPRAVVHCPGTHAFFARDPFPLGRCLAEGANLCLGTDSLASCDSLSMLDMIRIAGREFPQLTGPQLLNLATLNPSRLLVFRPSPSPLGIIARHAAADFVALRPPGASGAGLRALLTDEATRVDSVWIAGEKAA
jgi:cytosine/adenosine deaminase-related metal-dependent hydrolase